MKLTRALKTTATWVAPRTGAWIETRYGPGQGHGIRSPPARGRGLKLWTGLSASTEAGRPPHGGVD